MTAAFGTQFDPDVVRAFCRVEKEFERLALELTDESVSITFPSRADADPEDIERVATPTS